MTRRTLRIIALLGAMTRFYNMIITVSETYHSSLPAADPICMWVAEEVVMVRVINELAG